MSSIEFIAENLEPIRIDTYAATVQGISRSRLKNGLEKLEVNGKNAKLSYKLIGGETVFLQWDDPIPETIEAEKIPLDIIYEDNAVCVVNKAQGMVTHPGCGNMSGTLVNALMYHRGQEGFLLDDNTNSIGLRAGICHRLDKDTSGVIITAKDIESESFLQEQFKERRTQKEYIAIVQGHPPQYSGTIKTQIERHPKNRKLFAVTEDKTRGKFAHTNYRCIAIYGQYSLLKLQIKTGRTHQIRVHMKYLGCPILGDPLYGKKDDLFPGSTLKLHARRLGIRLPPNSIIEKAKFGEDKSLVYKSQDIENFVYFTAKTPTHFRKVMKVLHDKFEKTNFTKRY